MSAVTDQQPFVLPKSRKTLAREIIVEVAEKRKLPIAGLLSKSKYRPLCAARREAINRIHTEVGLPHTWIAEIFGMDHSSIIYYLQTKDLKT